MYLLFFCFAMNSVKLQSRYRLALLESFTVLILKASILTLPSAGIVLSSLDKWLLESEWAMIRWKRRDVSC